jgi:hypothetical protein
MKVDSTLKKIKGYLQNVVQPMNDSKIFAGLVILTLNLSSKMITLPMSRTVESVVKHSFSQYVLVFAIAWMGTREILVALTVTLIFGICMEFLFNEKSAFCCLSEGFVTNRINALEAFEGIPNQLTDDEINKAVSTLKKAQEILNTSKSPPTK